MSSSWRIDHQGAIEVEDHAGNRRFRIREADGAYLVEASEIRRRTLHLIGRHSCKALAIQSVIREVRTLKRIRQIAA